MGVGDSPVLLGRMRTFHIKIESAPDDSAVEVGEQFERRGVSRVVIGRGEDVDLRLLDATVSSEHLALYTTGNLGFGVEVLTQRGATFLDRQRLSQGDVHVVMEGSAFLQIGRVLLHVRMVQETLPVETMLSLPMSAALTRAHPFEGFLSVRVGARAGVHVCGEERHLFPSSLRLLWCLASSTGEVVGHEALRVVMAPGAGVGGANVAQNVSYVRTMFQGAIEEGLLDVEALRTLVVGGVEEEQRASLRAMDARGLLRMLVQSVRGRGYRLNLAPSEVYVE